MPKFPTFTTAARQSWSRLAVLTAWCTGSSPCMLPCSWSCSCVKKEGSWSKPFIALHAFLCGAARWLRAPTRSLGKRFPWGQWHGVGLRFPFRRGGAHALPALACGRLTRGGAHSSGHCSVGSSDVTRLSGKTTPSDECRRVFFKLAFAFSLLC